MNSNMIMFVGVLVIIGITGILILPGLLMTGNIINEQIVEEDMNREDINNDNRPVKEISMTAKQFEFNPSVLRVNQGDKIRLIITSTDVDHGFAINEFNVKSKLKSGETTIVEFVADKKGEFNFYCSVFCGSGHSVMNGKIIVE